MSSTAKLEPCRLLIRGETATILVNTPGLCFEEHPGWAGVILLKGEPLSVVNRACVAFGDEPDPTTPLDLYVRE